MKYCGNYSNLIQFLNSKKNSFRRNYMRKYGSKNNKLLITRIWSATFKDNVPYFNFWTISNKITIVMVSSVTFLQFSNSRICVHTRSSTYISNCWSKKLQFAISGRLDKVLNDRIYCEISKANQVFVFAVDALHL